MRYLLDVNALLAGALARHPQHADAFAWLEGKSVALCPISELGFLRIGTNKKAINLTMEDARAALSKFSSERNAQRIPDEQPSRSFPANAMRSGFPMIYRHWTRSPASPKM